MERLWTIEQPAVVTRVSTEVRERDARLHYLLLSGGHGERVRLSRGCCCRKDGGGHGERVRLSRGCCCRKDGGGHGERVRLSRGCCCSRKDGGGHGERVRLSRGCCYRKDGNEQWTIRQPAVVTRVSTEVRERDARLHYLLLSGGHGERVCLSRGCRCRKDGGDQSKQHEVVLRGELIDAQDHLTCYARSKGHFTGSAHSRYCQTRHHRGSPSKHFPHSFPVLSVCLGTSLSRP